jgi:Epoxide hydrolase N terminus
LDLEVGIEASGLTRRQLLRRGVAAGLAVGAAGVVADAPAAGAAQPTTAPRLRDGLADPTGIHPFRVRFSGKQLAALRRRVAATRWPSMELVADRSQGVQLATAQALARFWRTRYDWRRFEAKLNALPQFKTEIDGVDIHFIHVRSRHKGALPLIMTHGWPGSIVELLETVEPLTNPPRTAAAPPTPSTWCCRPYPATASRASRPSSAGRQAAPRALGRS